MKPSIETQQRPDQGERHPKPKEFGAPGRQNPVIASLKGIYIIWWRDVLRFWREKIRVIASLGQPILFLFVFGVGLSPAMGQLGQGAGGFSYVQFMFPGIIVMAVLFTAIFSAVSIVWDREFGFLKEVLVAPVPRWSVAVGKALGGSTTAMVQGVIMLVLAPFVGVTLTPLTVVMLLPVMFLTAFAMTSFGLLVAARMQSMEGFQVIMNFLLMPMFFLSGALFPLQNLPDWLAVLTRIDPVTYGVDAIRRIVLSGSASADAVSQQFGLTLFGQTLSIAANIAIVAAFAAIVLTLAVRAFSLTE